jgi:SAM-dependent MidA family methyltransferase
MHHEPPARPPGPDLPSPTPDEAQRSAQLAELIRRDIDAAGGAVDFSRFMNALLYTPQLGYYSGAQRKFGAAGDFVTAPELGELFGRCVAHQCADVLRALAPADLLEVGAGSGALAATMLTELERRGALPERYRILELSAALRARQRETLERRTPQLLARVEWLDTLPPSFRGIIVGNEILDAMPVERFRITAAGVRQLQVTCDNGAFRWHERDADPTVRRRIEPLQLGAGYESEVGLQAEAWMRSIATTLEAGVLLLFDYGFPRAEFYHPDRGGGTLMCHYRHRAHTDPLILPGLQDVTAHVDFSAVAAAGIDAGLALLGYGSQAMFLLGAGLAQFMGESDPGDVARHARLAHEVNRLTSPAEMGELFKVIALGRGADIRLSGFAMQDRRHRL